jgi:hypothetical protein
MKKTALFAMLLCLSSSAFGFSLNGRKWFSSADARFYYNSASGAACCHTASELQNKITSGINAWGIASYGGTTTRSGAKRDGQNVISWGKLGGTTLGVTNYISTDTSQSQVCNGTLIYRFTEVDVRFNSAFSWQNSSGCSGGFDLAGVSVHEFGHAVGLGHSNVQGATMYPSISSCNFSASSLDSDDRAGYSYIYSGCN